MLANFPTGVSHNCLVNGYNVSIITEIVSFLKVIILYLKTTPRAAHGSRGEASRSQETEDDQH